MKQFAWIAALLLAVVAAFQATCPLAHWRVGIGNFSVALYPSAVFASLADVLTLLVRREAWN